MNELNVAIAGATGAVGEAMISKSWRNATFPVAPVVTLAGERVAPPARRHAVSTASR